MLVASQPGIICQDWLVNIGAFPSLFLEASPSSCHMPMLQGPPEVHERNMLWDVFCTRHLPQRSKDFFLFLFLILRFDVVALMLDHCHKMIPEPGGYPWPSRDCQAGNIHIGISIEEEFIGRIPKIFVGWILRESFCVHPNGKGLHSFLRSTRQIRENVTTSV